MLFPYKGIEMFYLICGHVCTNNRDPTSLLAPGYRYLPMPIGNLAAKMSPVCWRRNIDII